MADLDRSFLVIADPDAAFDVLADPVRLPEWVPTIQLVDSIAIEGEADPDTGLTEREGAPEAGFTADRKTRTLSWGRPEHDYAGSIAITAATASSSTIAVHLHTRGDADPDAVARVFDEAIASIRRLMTRLR
jgi:hypothetical protein